jgi:hypothetical protein
MLTDRVQLARFDIDAEALAGMAIAILPFPHQPLVQQFVQELHQHKKKTCFPNRRLNNALLACTNSLTHGFEANGDKMLRALTVLTDPKHQPVTNPSRLYELLTIGFEQWTKQIVADIKPANPAIMAACERFLNCRSLRTTRRRMRSYLLLSPVCWRLYCTARQ